ncbi:PREDICTED: uncharacterized protein LOC102029339 [Chinchilla lanigera]|uniref:uncharacterized protein LOC102029339 n=1 Tax=Chinchilla lanigera TaxID=34839 RepID=UPI00038EB4F4|nr:PREDICTED: uncharacterized protein LOC102029339 [Chinchilla lanigera]XP_005413707.1 PREDICTED: uncharacterized protein LOC102029339 [Chinchilla lanigera]
MDSRWQLPLRGQVRGRLRGRGDIRRHGRARSFARGLLRSRSVLRSRGRGHGFGHGRGRHLHHRWLLSQNMNLLGALAEILYATQNEPLMEEGHFIWALPSAPEFQEPTGDNATTSNSVEPAVNQADKAALEQAAAEQAEEEAEECGEEFELQITDARSITQYEFDNWGNDFIYEEEEEAEEQTENTEEEGVEEGPEKDLDSADDSS